MAAAWAQVVRDVCSRKEPERPEPEPEPEHEDSTFEEPLFASRLPANGLTPALQAIAAVIDEDHAPRPQAASRPSKRKVESLGETQVCLARTGLEPEAPSPAQRQKVTDEATGMQL